MNTPVWSLKDRVNVGDVGYFSELTGHFTVLFNAQNPESRGNAKVPDLRIKKDLVEKKFYQKDPEVVEVRSRARANAGSSGSRRRTGKKWVFCPSIFISQALIIVSYPTFFSILL